MVQPRRQAQDRCRRALHDRRQLGASNRHGGHRRRPLSAQPM